MEAGEFRRRASAFLSILPGKKAKKGAWFRKKAGADIKAAPFRLKPVFLHNYVTDVGF
jgi:hypothetical protein